MQKHQEGALSEVLVKKIICCAHLLPFKPKEKVLCYSVFHQAAMGQRSNIVQDKKLSHS